MSLIKLGNSSFASGGVVGVEYGEQAAPIKNPAVLQSGSLSLYAEIEKRNPTEYFFSDMEYDGQNILPVYAAVVFPYDKFTFAVGYGNIYNQ